jgi:hypothetical protein
MVENEKETCVCGFNPPDDPNADCERCQLICKLAAFTEVEAWIKSKHNGYDDECRKVMHELKEPATLVQALEELMAEQEALQDYALARRRRQRRWGTTPPQQEAK